MSQGTGEGSERTGRPDTVISVAEGVAPLSPGQRHRRLRAAALAGVEELLQLAQEAGADMQVPPPLSTLGNSASRVDVSVGLVAAALWRTAHILNVAPFVLGEMPPPQADEQPLTEGIPPFAEIDTAVRRAQVQDLFVESLITLRRRRFGIEVDWNRLPTSLHMTPAWRGARHDGTVELRLRSRSNKVLVARLIRRYRDQALAVAPDGIKPESLLASSSSEYRYGCRRCRCEGRRLAGAQSKDDGGTASKRATCRSSPNSYSMPYSGPDFVGGG